MKRKDSIVQGTDAWHHIRKGKISGTVLKQIMGTPKARQDALWELISERLCKGLPEEENAMERGHRLEPEALAAFEYETGKIVERTGFVEDDDNSFIAQSPDGLIGETEAVEVKCPGGRNYVKAWLTNEVPDEYYWQVIQYFVVNSKLETLHFVLYNPDIPVHPLHVIKVQRESLTEDIAKARDEQLKFLHEVDDKLSGIVPF